jgi:hypothetical protein
VRLRNSRETGFGAKQLLVRMVVRAAPLALVSVFEDVVDRSLDFTGGASIESVR